MLHNREVPEQGVKRGCTTYNEEGSYESPRCSEVWQQGVQSVGSGAQSRNLSSEQYEERSLE